MLKKGDVCYFIENNFRVIEATILSINGNLYTVKFGDGKATRLPKHRIYESQEEAEKRLPHKEKTETKKYKSPYDYM